MVDGVLAALFAIATGFVAAGICQSAYRLVTNARLRFESPSGREALPALRVTLLVIAGPLIILRNSWRAATEGLRPVPWLVASAIVASAWSFCLGVAMLNLMVILSA